MTVVEVTSLSIASTSFYFPVSILSVRNILIEHKTAQSTDSLVWPHSNWAQFWKFVKSGSAQRKETSQVKKGKINLLGSSNPRIVCTTVVGASIRKSELMQCSLACSYILKSCAFKSFNLFIWPLVDYAWLTATEEN